MMPGKSNKPSAEKTVRDIRRATRRRYSAEEKIRIVLEGLRGEDSIAALCRREGRNANVHYGSTTYRPLINLWLGLSPKSPEDGQTCRDIFDGFGSVAAPCSATS